MGRWIESIKQGNKGVRAPCSECGEKGFENYELLSDALWVRLCRDCLVRLEERITWILRTGKDLDHDKPFRPDPKAEETPRGIASNLEALRRIEGAIRDHDNRMENVDLHFSDRLDRIANILERIADKEFR